MISATMKLLSIQPTVFLQERDGKLRQLVRVTVENPGGLTEAEIRVSARESRMACPLGSVGPGVSRHDAFIEESAAAGQVEFTLVSGGCELDRKVVDWRRPKRWRVHVVQLSHHDVGYTDLASNVFRQHDAFLDRAIEMAEATQGFPFDAQFRLVVEQAWSISHYLRHAPPERASRMIELIHAGRIEVTALFGNMTTEICGHETLVRALYPAFGLKRRYGIPIVSAEHNDVPGMSWGLCQALAEAGIRYFAPGLPLYYNWNNMTLPSFWDQQAVFGHDGPGAFWWESPSGKRILLWCNNSGCGGDCRATLPGLASRLQELAGGDYPYDLMRWPVLGGARDNSPYIEGYAHTVKQWNETWAFPRLICSTNALFFEEFEKGLPSDLPVRRGELAGQDYPVGAMSTAAATVVNRGNHAQLPAAEKLASVAAVAGLAYPKEALDAAYEDLLWYDEHTWGTRFRYGPAEGAAYHEKMVHAYRAAALGHDVLNKALGQIADQVRLDEQGAHLVAFNPLATERTGPVSVPLRAVDNCGTEMVELPPEKDGDGGFFWACVLLGDRWHVQLSPELVAGGFDLIDMATGASVPYQIHAIESPDEAAPYAAERWGLGRSGAGDGPLAVDPATRREMCFVAEGVPATGYKTYRLAPAQCPTAFGAPASADNVIENEYYRILADPDSGRVTGIYDKELGRSLLDSGAPHGFGELVVRTPNPGEEYVLGGIRPRGREAGPVYAELSWSASAHGHPAVCETIRLYRGQKRIEVAIRVLKDPTPLLDVHLAFPLKVEPARFRYEGVLSVMNPIGDYLPGSQSDRVAVQNWAKVTDGQWSVLWSPVDAPVASFGNLWPGYVSQAHRCVCSAEMGHPPLEEGDLKRGWIYSNLFANNFKTNFSVSQTGSVLFRYVITSCAGDATDAEAGAFGWDARTPFETMFTEGPRDGRRPLADAFLRVEPAQVRVLTWKQAEDGRGFILRLWNAAAELATARITFPHARLAEVRRTNVVEEDLSGPLEHDAQGFSVSLGSQELATVRVVFD